MSKKMVKWLSGSLIAMGALVAGCSESTTSEPVALEKDGVFLKNDAKQMWARITQRGIGGYFDSLSQEEGAPIIETSTRARVRCDAPALRMDENTRYLDELETLFDEGEQVEGVCGKALKLNDGQVAPLGVNLIDSMGVGTVEFWFRPNKDFYDKSARTLLGNDGARIHFFYKDGELYFQKNHHNLHYFVQGKAEFKNDDWNLIAGQWGDGYLSLWLNGKVIAYIEHDKGYVPADRGISYENLVVIGYKSSCCMEGPGQREAMTTSGSFDQFRISNIARYSMSNAIADTAATDTAATDTAATDSVVVVDPVFEMDTSLVLDLEFNDSLDAGRDFSGNGHHAVVAEGEVVVDSGLAYFDGASGLKISDGANIDLGDFFVEARILPKQLSGFRNIIVTEPPGYGPDGWILRIEKGKLMFYVRDAAWKQDWAHIAVPNLQKDKWYDVRVECTTKSIRLFVDGDLKVEREISGDYSSLMYPWGVGYDAVNQDIHNRYFEGYMDYIRVGNFKKKAPAKVELVVDTLLTDEPAVDTTESK